MTGWWPIFHDHAFALSRRDQVRLHWNANLRMLRDGRAVVRFTVVSLLPVPILLVVAALLRVDLAPLAAAPPLLLMALALVTLIAYLAAQHVAFRWALRHDYLPFVRLALRDMGHPVCMRCGHPCRPPEARPASQPGVAEVSHPCPECGLIERAGEGPVALN